MRDDLDDLARRLRVLERREPPLAAEFIDTAGDPGDDLRVIARGWDEGEHTFGPVRWSPVGGALPAEGDEAVIVERDDGVWQVVAWWSDSQSTGVAQSAVDALDARLDALEATREIRGTVNTNGTTAVGTGFTSSRNGNGDYTIAFTTAFGGVPVISLTLGITGGLAGIKQKDAVAVTASGFSVYTFSTVALTDSAFHFIARGPA